MIESKNAGGLPLQALQIFDRLPKIPGSGTNPNQEPDPVVGVTLCYQREVGKKVYEMSDHLGNALSAVMKWRRMRVVFTDQREAVDNGGVLASNLAVVSFNDYYAFGMLEPGRTVSSDEYRYGFNGMEKDDEVKGEGNSYDFGARMYDSRLGRWLSRDGMEAAYVPISTYSFALNNPIILIDNDGNIIYDSKGNLVTINQQSDGTVTFNEGIAEDTKHVLQILQESQNGMDILLDMDKSQSKINVKEETAVFYALRSNGKIGMDWGTTFPVSLDENGNTIMIHEKAGDATSPLVPKEQDMIINVGNIDYAMKTEGKIDLNRKFFVTDELHGRLLEKKGSWILKRASNDEADVSEEYARLKGDLESDEQEQIEIIKELMRTNIKAAYEFTINHETNHTRGKNWQAPNSEADSNREEIELYNEKYKNKEKGSE